MTPEVSQQPEPSEEPGQEPKAEKEPEPKTEPDASKPQPDQAFHTPTGGDH